MKLRWMESGVVRVTSSASIKHMARDWKRNKGQKARGGTVRVRSSGSANEEWEMHGHEGEKEGENMMEMGKARNWGREKNRSVEVIYASCIIFYNAAPPFFPYGSPFLLNIQPSHQGVLLFTVTPRNSPWPHQPVIKILPWCDCSTSQMEDWT